MCVVRLCLGVKVCSCLRCVVGVRVGVSVVRVGVSVWGVLRYQIARTQAEPQRIVAQRPLSRVQSLVLYLSRIQRICLSLSLNLLFRLVCSTFVGRASSVAMV